MSCSRPGDLSPHFLSWWIWNIRAFGKRRLSGLLPRRSPGPLLGCSASWGLGLGREALFFLITRHIRSHGRVLPNGVTEVTCPPQFWLSLPSHHLHTPWSLAGWIQRTQGKPWAGEATELLKEGVLEPSSGSDSHPSSHQPQGLSQEWERGREVKKNFFFMKALISEVFLTVASPTWWIYTTLFYSTFKKNYLFLLIYLDAPRLSCGMRDL